MTDLNRATTETENPNVSAEHRRDGDARQPGDMLDRNLTDPNDDSDFVARGTRRPRGRF